MKEYPVGSLCVMVGTLWHPELLGAELTITEPLAERYSILRDVSWVGYGTDLIHNNTRICPEHRFLRLKKFPPTLDQWCNEMMLKVLKPVEIKDEEIMK